MLWLSTKGLLASSSQDNASIMACLNSLAQRRRFGAFSKSFSQKINKKPRFLQKEKKMNTTYSKIAAVLSAIIGAMAIFAGGQVLLGKIPDYYVIDWLPVYNFILGVLSTFVTAILIWKDNRFAMTAAMATFGLHATVMLILKIAYADVVAPDSIRAMTVRMVAWIIILTLMFVQKRKNQAS
jgi:hypothetical protein